MKKYLIRIISIPVMCALAVGCTDEINLPQQAGLMPISIGASYPTLTRASDSGFDDGDCMGLFVLDYLDADNPQSVNSSNVHGNNVKYSFNLASGTWSAATTLYWTSTTTPADIIGYYPFKASLTNPEEMNFTIGRRQDVPTNSTSMGDYEASDLLWCKSTKVMPTAERVNLTFRHLMSGVKISLNQGSGFTDEEWTSVTKTVLVSGVRPDASVNLVTGGVTVKTESAPVSITPFAADGEWRAVVVPQTLPAGTKVISLSVDGVSYHLTKASEFTYQEGHLHKFTITVNRQSDGTLQFVVGDDSIEPWIDSAEFRDGLMREYVVIDVPQHGTLADVVKAKGIAPSDVRNLKLTGELDSDDFGFIRDNFHNMGAINLYQAEVYNDNQPETLPERALSGMESLRHVVFPRHLKVIGKCAFTNSGLMGDLIIPEGVTHIGWNPQTDDCSPGHWGGGDGVFAYCSSLTGELSLPSTLEFIEMAAFYRTSLSGDLHIPDGVTFIGAMAFDTTDFTGQLSLPENLRELGMGAFYNTRFSGDLVLPQGITKIRAMSFTGGRYSHISLPEGLKEIGDEAFSGCQIRGELVLPSTLQRIGAKTFESNKFSGIVFNSKLSYIGEGAFRYNDRLMGTITLPQGVKTVQERTFEGCTLLDGIILHDEISMLGGGAFKDCYNLTSIVCNNPEPPLLDYMVYGGNLNDLWYPFKGVPMDNFTLQVPKKSVELYKQAKGWREFKRISEYSNFVCRPSKACALNSAKDLTIVLNADGPWTVQSKPDWCSVYPSSGNGKTELTLSIDELSNGSADRNDVIEFSLTGTDITAECSVSQYDYRYAEDQCVTLQKATAGNGIDVVFIADGFDAEAISKDKYIDLVNKQMAAFFGIEPYSTYRDRFNVYACISLSQENGVNTSNNWRDTRFMTLYSHDASSLVLNEPDEVFDYVIQHTPLTDGSLPRGLVIMTLNSDEYGGVTLINDRGCAISICPPSNEPYPMDTRGVVQHEACGHGFGKLAEERVVQNRYLNKTEIAYINDCQRRGWFKNISVSGKLTDVPWAHLVFNPRYSVAVDVYEGAFGVTRGAYRSELNSCMNYGIPYFNAISRQAIVEKILGYSGEGFSMETFFAHDSDRWGSTSQSVQSRNTHYERSAAPHYPVILFKSKKH